MGLHEESEYRKFSSIRDFKRLSGCQSMLRDSFIKDKWSEVDKQRHAFAKEFEIVSKDPMWRLGK